MSRLRILAIAYACNPRRGSEFGVGWGWVSSIASEHQVKVITADFNSGDIEDHPSLRRAQSSCNLQFTYVKNRAWHYRPDGIWLTIEASLAKPIMNLAYQDWLRCALHEAEKEIANNKYDLVHLITYVGWRFPGRFYRLGIPFVWGPIGGMKNTPWQLLPVLGVKGAIYYGARNIINSLQMRVLKGPKRALRSAGKGVIAATSEIQREIWNWYGVNSHVICEVGPPELQETQPELRSQETPFVICWSGTHLPGKALQILLHAVARLPRSYNFRVEIIGDGPCREAWQDLARELHIDEHCCWKGWLSRDNVLSAMQKSHVFAITSLKDLTSNVAVEAVSAGLPIVCLDHCGFADLVTDECGIRIPIGSMRQMSEGFTNALSVLYEDEGLRRRLAQGAVQRSQDYSWASKMVALDRVYAEVIPAGDGMSRGVLNGEQPRIAGM